MGHPAPHLKFAPLLAYALGVLSLLVLLAAGADARAQAQPAVAFVIDDMGYSLEEVEQVLALEGPVAVAVLPDTPYAAPVATRVGAAGREVLLHQPMAPRNGERNPGPRVLTLEMSAYELDAMLTENLARVPGAVGMNGHMGSLLTTHADVMREVMRLLRRRGDLFFVDSFTHPQSVGLRQARRHGLLATRRDVFLDHDPREAAVREQLDRLRRLARERGSALAIGHPGTPTLRLLRTAIPALREEGYRVLSVRELIALQSPQQLERGSDEVALARGVREGLVLPTEATDERP
ncbi:MAG: divergent polysaccharide deacetylase family protein [Pseudomonadota bacterium]